MVQPKSERGIRLGIINPLTLVGQEIQTVLRERSFPFFKVTLLDTTGEQAGALTEINDEPAVVTPASEIELEDLDLVFFCGPPAKNREWIEKHRDQKFVAIDLSQPTATEEGKLAVAGLNLDGIAEGDRLLVSPHPIAIPIAIILNQIATFSAIDLCTATVIQPASEFEQKGVEELARQTVAVLNIKSVPKEVFDRQLAFNLYPAPEGHEEFIAAQVGVLTRPAELALFVTQGTIFHGHTFSMFIRTHDPLEERQVIDALRSNRAIAFAEGDQQLGTIDAAGRDEILIAAVRPDPSIKGGFWVWAVCDNLRRSAALNAVLVAEKVLFGTGVTH
jgi:aspartate-semialdehyde dehydrogenase